MNSSASEPANLTPMAKGDLNTVKEEVIGRSSNYDHTFSDLLL